jgi:hypothetical protein
VLVNLTSSLGMNVESKVLSELWREMARRFGDVKFCEIRGDMCIEGYPDRNTPTILIYRNGDIKRQIVTLRELGGVRTKLEDLERLLVDVGAVKENDMRSRRRDDVDDEGEGPRHTQNGRKNATDDDDNEDDWD